MNLIKKPSAVFSALLILFLTCNQINASICKSLFPKPQPKIKREKFMDILAEAAPIVFWASLGFAATALFTTFILNNNPHEDQVTKKTNDLIEACLDGNFDNVRQLVQNGADINFESQAGSPAYIALETNNSDLLLYLIYNGADIESAITNFEKEYQLSPELVKLLEPFYEKLLIFKKKFPKKSQRIQLVLHNFLDKYTPVHMKQKELINLIKIKQKIPNIANRKDMQRLFDEVPFNKIFLKDLHDNKLINFVIDNRLVDKNKRDILEGCLLYSNDEEVIDAITTRIIQACGNKRPKKQNVFHSSYKKTSRFFKKLLGKKIPKKKDISNLLKEAKAKNSVFFNNLVSKLEN